ncbi:MAG: SRPBCC family protein [Granulosicoccus sp.]|nr:SRPBCC family protein [Granulosicoccus sp.]
MIFEDAFGAEFRELDERDHNGKPARVVAASRIYSTTETDLWDAITNKERLSRWFAPVEGTLEPGGRYKIKGNAKGKILWCEPYKGFNLTWVFFFNTSWVNVRLTAEDNGTRLTLEHIMHKGRMSERHWNKYGPGATGVGWDLGFLALGVHLDANGDSIGRSDHDAWLKTDKGKTFMRACAAAWGESHIAAGKPAETAKAMANATADFYAGS